MPKKVAKVRTWTDQHRVALRIQFGDLESVVRLSPQAAFRVASQLMLHAAAVRKAMDEAKAATDALAQRIRQQ